MVIQSYKQSKKKKELIKTLQDQIEKNKKQYEINNAALEMQIELAMANHESYELEKKRCDLQLAMLKIELENMDFLTAIQKFHTMKEWKELFRQLKEYDIEKINKDLKTAKINFDNQQYRIENFLFVFQNPTTAEKIFEQQKQIKIDNSQMEENLVKLGVDVKSEKQPSQEYIG